MSRLVLLLVIACAACSSEKPSPSAAPPSAPAPVPPPPDAAPPDAAPLPPDAPRYNLSVPTFDGRPGFLVLGEHFKRLDRAFAADVPSGIDSHVIETGLFSNLRPGFFAVVYGRFDDRDAAQRHVDALAASGIDVYIKPSGPVAAPWPDAPVPERLTHIRGQLTAGVTGEVELTLATEDADPERKVAFAWRGRGARDVEFDVWTNVTGAVEASVAVRCDRDCPQVTCQNRDRLELTPAGGDVVTGADCVEWAGE